MHTRFVYIMCICGQKTGCLRSYSLKSLVSVTYCLLVELTAEKSLLHQVIRSGKEMRNNSINRIGKGFPENCIMVSHTLSTSNAASYTCTCMQCYSNAELDANMQLQLQCRPTILLQVQSVLIMLSVQRVCVLWNSSFVCDSMQLEVHVNTCRQCKNRKSCIPATHVQNHFTWTSSCIASRAKIL